MVEICSLASGSNGNCYYVANEKDAILVDAGIYFKRLKERLEQSCLDISKIRAIFVSHEHGDHIRGLKVISKKLNIPCYFSEKTFNNTYKNSRPENYKFFHETQDIQIGDIQIHSFQKYHDTIDPYSFIVTTQNVTIGVMTDIGRVDKTLQDNFSMCDAVFLESNYDPEMLKNGNYPAILQNRIRGGNGHLSNQEAFDLVANYAKPTLQTIIISHISAENNSPKIVDEVFASLKDKYTIYIAPRYEAGKVFFIKK